MSKWQEYASLALKEALREPAPPCDRTRVRVQAFVHVVLNDRRQACS